MWATRAAFATRTGSLTALETILTENEKKLEGSGALFGRMLDNHDTSRFISEAAGTAGDNPWESPGPQPTDAALYLRQEMAFAFVFTLPGLPVLYHGDEIGLAGAGDPDSRRVMPSLDAISPAQAHLRGTVRRLSALRRCLPALRTGARVPLAVTDDTYAYLRDQGDGRPVIALFSLRAAATSIDLPVGMTPAGDYEDAFTGEKITLAEGGAIPMPPESFRILLPASSPCPPNL
jgi:glycosidase